MKKSRFMFAGTALILALVLVGCPNPNDSEDPDVPPVGTVPVTAFTLDDVFSAPNTGSSPQKKNIDRTQYTGSIAWKTVDGDNVTDFTGDKFLASTVYRAVLTLAANPGFSFTGVGKDAFKFSGATVTNDANSGSVTVTFPETATQEDAQVKVTVLLDASYFTAPVKGATPVTTPIPENSQYTSGAIVWKNDKGVALGATDKFGPGTVYTAVVTLVAKPGYTFTGVAENEFTVTGTGITAANGANSGIVNVSFPKTETEKLVGSVTLSGDVVLRGTLVVNTSNEFKEGTGELSYVWERSTNKEFDKDTPVSSIEGASGASYTIDPIEKLDVDKYIRVTVSRAGYEGTVVTNIVGPVQENRIVNLFSLGGLFTAPVTDGTIPASAATNISTAQYTGKIEWYNATTSTSTPATGTFQGNTLYKAIVRLTAKRIDLASPNKSDVYNYTIEGVKGDSFYYTGASSVTYVGNGVIEILFPTTAVKTNEGVALAIVNQLTLDGLISAPLKDGVPARSTYDPKPTAAMSSQYTITSEWRHENGDGIGIGGDNFSEKFELGKVYKVVLTFAPKSGFTFTGAAKFTYEGVTITQTTDTNPVVTIVFPPVLDPSVLFVGFNYGDITINNSSGEQLRDIDRTIYKFPDPLDGGKYKETTLVATDAYTDVMWYVDDNPGTSGKEITIRSANYQLGTHSVTFTGKRGGNLYSRIITFTVEFN